MDEHQDAELVVDALTMALARCTPDPDGLVHHADRGSQTGFNRSSQRLAITFTIAVKLVKHAKRYGAITGPY